MNEESLPSLPIPFCPVMLVLDTSHSMWGQGMRDQQDALRAFQKTLEALEFTDSRIEIAAVGMGENLRVLQPFTPLADSIVGTMSIRPKGDTPVGGALRLALCEIKKRTDNLRRAGERVAPPQLLILSDGKSSDDFAAEADEIRRDVAAGRLFCRAVATGSQPDLGTLARIAGENVVRPDYGRLRETFAQIGEKVSQTYEDAVPELLMPRPDPASGVRPPEKSGSASTGALTGRTIFVDGTNVCFWNRNGTAASLAPLLALVRAFDAERADWHVCFDASTRHHLSKTDAMMAASYEELLRRRPDRFAEAPGGVCADLFILEAAAAVPDSIIVTNDFFRDHKARFPFVGDKNRFFRGGVFNNQLCIPELGIRCVVEAQTTPEPTGNRTEEKSFRRGGNLGKGFLI